MSWTHKQRITVVAIVVLLAVVPLSLQIGDVRAAQALDAQKNKLVEQTVTPPSDYDGDGIPDSTDRCPTRPEKQNGFQDLDGCPDEVRIVQASEVNRTDPANGSAVPTQTPPSTPSDYDGDGIPDSADRCPTRPETMNGYQDGDGCPDVVSTTGAS